MNNSETIAPVTRGYALAGWLAIASAILVIPQIVFALALEYFLGRPPVWKIIMALMNVMGLMIGVYVLYVFRRLLNERYSFHAADTVIVILIILNIVSFFIGIFGLIPGLELTIGIVAVALFVPYGIINIVFGVQMLKLTDDLFGLLKPFAYLTLSTGILAATFFLAPFGLLVAVIALTTQGIILLRAGEDTEYL